MQAFVATADILVNSMGPVEMEMLGAERVALVRLRSRMSGNSCTARDHLVMDRLEHVRAGVEAGLDLYEAIDHAIAAVPGPELAPPTA
jgi:hypothetical protein